MSKLFMYDQYRVNPKSAITPTKMSLLVPDVASIQNDFLSWGGADEPTTVMVADNTVARVGTNLFDISGASVGLANLDSGDAFEAGAPYYLYVCDPGNGSEDVETDEKLIVSLDSSYPVGWAAGNTRQIGGFKVGSSGDIILESSLWTLLTRRYASGSVLADITEALLLAGTEGNGAGLHNSIYRGKYLGDAVTAEQWEAIRLGTFDGLWIGDYWTINGVNWRVADFDYFYKSGDTACMDHHAMIVPDISLYTAQMNTTDVVTGAYVSSAMRQTNLTQAKSTVKAAFGAAHILAHRLYLANAVDNSRESARGWYDSDGIELMTEPMVYGGHFFATFNTTTGIMQLQKTENKQLNLFRLRPDMVANRQCFWLQDVAASKQFCLVDPTGSANYNPSSVSNGVRPAFPIYQAVA